ncbi:histidine phosphatase family protein [Thalassospira mesophila]|uniref:Phosphoglycerate mutase n=1 Tax=Thalassospira mesophila TaxID=1293891 RepID=A0A1Y2L483_9PROT|nr:histidine phosphatase family protein [Thalassospira mesophila]OSQ40303.1 hypothetical protein TMES_00200 [Thalassospira mesophila]
MNDLTLTRWWLVRHAPVDNPRGVIYGRSDLPAVFDDEATLARVAAMLPADAVAVTSHLSRSVESMKRLAGNFMDLSDIHIVPELAEQDFGAWEGLCWDDIPAPQTQAFWDDYAHAQPPEGESFGQLIDRVNPVFRALNRHYTGKNIVAVVHGGTIRAILAGILGLAPERALMFDIPPLSVTRLDYLDAPDNAGWRIGGINLGGVG